MLLLLASYSVIGLYMFSCSVGLRITVNIRFFSVFPIKKILFLCPFRSTGCLSHTSSTSLGITLWRAIWPIFHSSQIRLLITSFFFFTLLYTCYTLYYICITNVKRIRYLVRVA